ncbi:unnamed protein product [Ixodes pacificus]
MAPRAKQDKLRASKQFCTVPGCVSARWKYVTTSYHKFPAHGMPRRSVWIHKLRIGKKVTCSMVVCSRHFIHDDFFFPGSFSSLLTKDNVNSFTGPPSLEVLNSLVSCYRKIVRLTNKHQLSARERVVLTIMKLKHNVSTTFLKNLFRCSLSTCTRMIVETTRVLSQILRSVVCIPSKECERALTLENMPVHFRPFQNVRLLLDCTEMAIAQPKCLRCALLTYSFYKKGFTCKYMISVTPSGVIAHISKRYGGRSSDKAIFEQSGVLDSLLPVVDAIMIDRGFLIDSFL